MNFPWFLKLAFLSFLLLNETEARYWFDYSDCGVICMASDQPCLIRLLLNGFETECMLDGRCMRSAGDHAVCLRKNLPPIGGDHIWTLFKEAHPDTPIMCPQTIKPIILIVSFIFNFVLSVISTVVSVLCYKNRQRYTRFQQGPIHPQSPYSPTTTRTETDQAAANEPSEADAPLIP